MRPRLLDLFCGAGGCTKGYQQAGFYVVGVDISPQPNYCGEMFIRANALDVFDPGFWSLGGIGDFAAIHASPPCQAYTTMNNRHGSSSPPLIDETRELLEQTRLPYVIENVPGAHRWLRGPTRLTGSMVGIRAFRARLFETNWPLMSPPPVPATGETVAVYGKNDGRRLWTRKDGSELRVSTLEKARDGMGIDWMEWDELKEAVPPAYTELIGHQLLRYIQTEKAAA